jgi:hypothetical protein
VNEVFLEVGVPLLNDSFWGKMDLDLGGRHARYSTAGDANTWKVGMTWETPIPGIRLRALQSRDIRAPNLSELFFPPSGLNGSVNNDFVNAITPGSANGQQVRQLNEGNQFLKPEKSLTTEVGLVWQPEFLPGFQASVDYYRIAMKGPIISLGLQQVEDLCFNGFNTFCQQDAITTANGSARCFRLRMVARALGGCVKAFNFGPSSPMASTWGGLSVRPAGLRHPRQFRAVLITHTSKFIFDSGIPGTQSNGNHRCAGRRQLNSTTSTGVLNWKIQSPGYWRCLGLQRDGTVVFRWRVRRWPQHHRLRARHLPCLDRADPDHQLRQGRFDPVLRCRRELERQRQDADLCQRRQRCQHQAAGCGWPECQQHAV